MKTSLAIRLAFSLVAAGMAISAHAQYIWLDEHGVKQFSDQPPPASVPQKRILKEPAQTMRSVSDDDPDDTSGDDAATADQAPKTLEERNADFIKRRAEKAEKDKKAAEQAKQEAAKAKNCERARQYQNALASGERISTTDENGERSFMSDQQRAQDMKENQQILRDCE